MFPPSHHPPPLRSRPDFLQSSELPLLQELGRGLETQAALRVLQVLHVLRVRMWRSQNRIGTLPLRRLRTLFVDLVGSPLDSLPPKMLHKSSQVGHSCSLLVFPLLSEYKLPLLLE